jgi:hypothetical protein
MEERIDLSALDLDEGRRELLVAAIMANGLPELARRPFAGCEPDADAVALDESGAGRRGSNRTVVRIRAGSWT